RRDLPMATIHVFADGDFFGAGKLIHHPDASVTIEDLYHESGEEYAEEVYAAIQAAIARGESEYTRDGIRYTWDIEKDPPVPREVLGLGYEDWTDRDAGQEYSIDAHRWERYGTVEVRIGDVMYELGCVIGVPPALRGTAAAAGG